MLFSSKGSQKLKLNAQNPYRKSNARRIQTQTDQQNLYSNSNNHNNSNNNNNNNNINNVNINTNKPQSRLNLKSSQKSTNRQKFLDSANKNSHSNTYKHQTYHHLGMYGNDLHKSDKYQKNDRNQKSQKSGYNGSEIVHLGLNQNDKSQKQPSRKTTFKLHAYKNLHGNRYLRTQPDQYAQHLNQKIHTTATNTKATTIGVMKYQIDGTAGKGTFGVVYQGHIKGTGQRIAIKKVLQDKRYKNRQLQILKMLKHPSILQMKDHFMTHQQDSQYLNVVMDYYQQNLYQAIRKKEMSSNLIKIYAFQLLRGLNYLTMLSIAHRDIKPQNILVDRNKNNVVICDFGSAKQLVKGQTNLAYICSRCYRAPQLIFGAIDYTTQIDMWSIGCVIVQMINGDPPFLGDSQIDQLFQIVKVLGTPKKEDVLQMNHKYDIKQLTKFPNIKATQWKNLLRTKDVKLVDLVSKILCYSPYKRLTPSQAMAHPYFDDFRNQRKYKEILLKVRNIPSNMLQFTKDQLQFFGEQLSQKLQPEWTLLQKPKDKQKQIGMSQRLDKSQRILQNQFIGQDQVPIKNKQITTGGRIRGHARNYSQIASSYSNPYQNHNNLNNYKGISANINQMAQSTEYQNVNNFAISLNQHHGIHYTHSKNQGSYHGTGITHNNLNYSSNIYNNNYQQAHQHQTQVAYNYNYNNNQRNSLNLGEKANNQSYLLNKIQTNNVNLTDIDVGKSSSSYGVKKPSFLNKFNNNNNNNINNTNNSNKIE